MRKTVLVYGLIAGAILAAGMFATMPFIDQIGFDNGMFVGYTIMVAAFLMVFFGVRSYRENIGGGTISFGRGFTVGLLITVIASVCYVASWEIINYTMLPDFAEKYAAHVIEKEKASGKSQEAIDAKLAEMKKFQELYKNPVISSAMTFAEPLPVGLIVSLVCAGILRRKVRRESPVQTQSARTPAVF